MSDLTGAQRHAIALLREAMSIEWKGQVTLSLEAITQIRTALAHIESLETRIEAMRAALEPFAYEASEDDGSPRKYWAFAPDNEIIGTQFCDLTYGHFRAAREATR